MRCSRPTSRRVPLSSPDEKEEEPSLDQDPVPAGPPRRHTRRLEDKILVVFHHACDVKDLEVADGILQLLETMLNRRPLVNEGNRRRTMESLVAAYERLWHIRHQEIE